MRGTPRRMLEIKDHPMGVEVELECGHTVWMNCRAKEEFSIGDQYICKCCDSNQYICASCGGE